jgi:peptidoglycan/LPS O-acetylase OafA/YrhL
MRTLLLRIVWLHHRFCSRHDIGHPDRLRNYLTRRFVRLFPVYWLYVAIFCSLVAMGFGTAVTLPDTSDRWISTALLIRLDNLAFPIAPAWTLVHEVAFYLVFAALIMWGRTGKVVFALWMLACLLLRPDLDYNNMMPWSTYFSLLNLNFLIGMAAYTVGFMADHLGSKEHSHQVLHSWSLSTCLKAVACHTMFCNSPMLPLLASSLQVPLRWSLRDNGHQRLWPGFST